MAIAKPDDALAKLQAMSAVMTLAALTLLDSMIQYDGHRRLVVSGMERMGHRIDVLDANEWRAQQLERARDKQASVGDRERAKSPQLPIIPAGRV